MVRTIDDLKIKIEPYGEDVGRQINKAASVAERLHHGQARESGEPYISHPLAVAEILIDMKMDGDCIIGALLHDVLEDTEYSRLDLRREFGRNVEALVNGVTKISLVKAKNKTVQEAETIRKMLFAMVKDVRVILIKLADKLHNMRTLEHKRELRRREIAQETLDIYAPLAGRLGISWMKDELENLSLCHVNPNAFKQIAGYIKDQQEERGEYLNKVEQAIKAAARAENIDIEVETRAKHYYSIYEKMRRRNKQIEEIFDFLGIRVICGTATECYTLLGIVHKLWMPIEGRFKDYVAMPKSNRYQSLHTTVMGYDGKLTEIQIRTHEMHQTAEYGIAAHWLYKKGLDGASKGKHDYTIMKQVKSLGNVRITSSEFLDEIKRELLEDSIYVFTPKGDAIELPRGATAIDFAYHIHTEVGHHTMGAKADGHIVALKDPLKNTQVIEILTSPSAHPHLNWLRQVRTTRARSKIRAWLNKHDEDLFIDRSIVARRERGTKAATGKQPNNVEAEPAAKDYTPSTSRADPTRVGVRIGNERNMMIRFAQCCEPTTGDEIIGYVSRGRGIVVHRMDCPNLRFIPEFQERRIEVEWETVSPRETRRFHVVAHKSFDLFSEIEGAVRKLKGHLIEGRIADGSNGNIEAYFTLEMDRRDDFKRILKSIRAVPAVMTISEDKNRLDAVEAAR